MEYELNTCKLLNLNMKTIKFVNYLKAITHTLSGQNSMLLFLWTDPCDARPVVYCEKTGLMIFPLLIPTKPSFKLNSELNAMQNTSAIVMSKSETFVVTENVSC